MLFIRQERGIQLPKTWSPVGFLLFVKYNVMSERSVLRPGKMSALKVVDIKLALIKQKSRLRHCIPGFRLLRVKVFVSAFIKHQMSARSKESTIYFTFYKVFSCVTGSHLFCLFVHLKLD